MLDKQSLAELADIYKEKYNRLLKDNAELEMQIDEANVEVERLRKERDEARRSVCEQEAQDCFLMPDKLGKGTIVNTPQMEASRRGWDCYKEDSK